MFKVALASLLLTCAFGAQAGTSVDVSKIYGNIQYVDHYPDYKVQVVDHYPDSAGKWKTVDHYPDYKIQIVDHYPDFTIQYVD
ncbi:hypothetical protein HX797_24995 [Pseudomonas edaphica]|uniref:7(1) septoil knot domain-containing protein n=1 Tax=Pseudomonas edaphica TaxID=2006980 RepID=A0A7Y7V9M1_9PSED|nr:hypothetical protein [Pseudomonas edaphica]NVZ59535.1 hypothetical protein [Pseudomonas edaphica]